MEQFLFKLTIFFALFLAASTQPTVQLFLEKEMILDLSSGSSKNHQKAVNEWIIETDPNHIFYFSFLGNDGVDEKLISSSLTILDGNSPDSTILFPNSQLSPFYSTGNVVYIKFLKSSSLKGLQLKAAKAVPCPFTIGGSTGCGRVVDELSCYCALFSGRTWTATKDYCKANNFSFVAIETYEEDLALFTAFGGNERLWLGANDDDSDLGNFVWVSTGKPMVLTGYTGFYKTGQTCILYSSQAKTLPAWVEYSCTSSYGGICELQPTESTTATNLLTKNYK